MGQIKGLIVLGVVIFIIVWSIAIDLRCRYYFIKLAERYKNGIDIGCLGLKELAEKLKDALNLEAIVINDRVVVKEGDKKYNFFIENGMVMAKFPGYGKDKSLIDFFLRPNNLKKAISISKLMDRLVEKYNPEVGIEDPVTYIKARKVWEGIVATYIISAVIVAAVAVWAISNNSSKMIGAVKNSSLDGYAKCTVGEAFDSFFSNEEWSFFRADGKEHNLFDNFVDGVKEELKLEEKHNREFNVVEFTGNAYFNGKKVNVLVQFFVDDFGKNVHVLYIEVDGKAAEQDVAESMFNAIFEECSDENIASKIEKKKKPKKKKNKKEKKKKTKKKTAKKKNGRYSEEELVNAAYKYFTAKTGKDSAGVSLDHYDGDDAVIWINEDLGDRVGTLDWYTVNVYTGKGTDVAGNNIDIMNATAATSNKNNNSNHSNNEYIFPNSDREYLTDYDLQGMSSEECRIARNEIFARYGRMFKDSALQDYFNSKSWYTPSIKPENFNESRLNEYEKANVNIIKSYENGAGSGEESIYFAGVYANGGTYIDLQCYSSPDRTAYGLNVGYIEMFGNKVQLYEANLNRYISEDGSLTINVKQNSVILNGEITDQQTGDAFEVSGEYRLYERYQMP